MAKSGSCSDADEASRTAAVRPRRSTRTVTASAAVPLRAVVTPNNPNPPDKEQEKEEDLNVKGKRKNNVNVNVNVNVSPADEQKPRPKRKRLPVPTGSSNNSTKRVAKPRTQSSTPLTPTSSTTLSTIPVAANAVSPYFADLLETASSVVVKPSHTSKASAQKNTSKGKKTTPKPKAVPKRKTAPKVEALPLMVHANSSDDDDEEEEEEEEDRPFHVDYAPSSRATCRRCDEIIEKHALRVSHVPLFRGKPGFRVYRHVACATFADDIVDVTQIGGSRTLEPADRQVLALRIDAARQEQDQENQALEPDELVPVAFQGDMRKLPKGLTAALLPFQVEGASWMYHQETQKPEIRGGILADEMGMGKTVQTIATVLDNRPKLQHSRPGAKHPPSLPDVTERQLEETLWNRAVSDWKHEMDMCNVPLKMRPHKYAAARAGTLVVCPVIALHQWKTEIEKFTELDTLSVGIYHGPNRATDMPPDLMQKYDVVLTTYQVLEQDFRKMMSPNKISCPNCGGKFKVDKLRVHLKYFCGDGAERTEAQARQHRARDRDENGSGRGNTNRGIGGARGKKDKVKKPLTPTKKHLSTKSVAKTKQATRRTIRVKSSGDYESDSELSLDEPFLATPPQSGRPSRSAASKASKRMSKTLKEWGREGRNDNDESSFGFVSEGGDSDSSDEDIPPVTAAKLKSVAKKRTVSQRESSHESALDRACEKQRKAMDNVKKQKTGKKKTLGKKGKKKFDNEGSSESDSEGKASDPINDIDMNELMKEAMVGSRFSVLHSFCWWRIILDEAHFIKSRSSQTAASAFSLSAIHRWCLSGTPLQNRVGELYSLIRFLRIDPMAHYFCKAKGCDCKSIHYRIKDGKCQDCSHHAFSHYAHFNRYVLNPIQRDGYSGDGRRAMFKLKNEVLDKSLLRRTKETRAEDMNLPPRLVTIRPIRLHPVEQDFYDALYMNTKASFNDYVDEGTLLNNYAHIFDLLTKMRQAVDHPYMIVHSKKNTEKRRLEQGAPVANGSVDCDICHESPTERVVSSCCGSGFCRECVVEYLTGAGGGSTPCPSCQSPFSIDLNQASTEAPVDDGTLAYGVRESQKSVDCSSIPSLKELQHVPSGSILRRINLAEFATSSKIEVLVQELVAMRKGRPGSKALVFSQFVNMLDLTRWRIHSDPCLADLGLGVRILHGGMDVKSRDATLQAFREDPSVRVLLMSLKAGGVALNLTVASEVYLLDNWWNPAAEMQAIDRTHRLGQYRPIRAVRFIAEGTVEERVLQLQEKKRLVFDGTVGRDAGSLKMLTVHDMKALFT